MKFLMVFLGGGIGAMTRYGVSLYFENHGASFPWSTFIANIVASLILGILIGLNLRNGFSQNTNLLLMTGFCGGFSTFSTFSAESLELLKLGNISTALVYILASLVVGILVVFLGIKIASFS